MQPTDIQDNYIEPKFTTWHNDQLFPAVFTIFMGPVNPHSNTSKPRKITIPPKGKIDLPSEYDYAIRNEDNGVITGGLWHLLRKEGEKELPAIIGCIDVVKNKRQQEIEEISKNIEQQDKLKRATELYAELNKKSK